MKTITKEQRIKLGKLRERAIELNKQIDKLIDEAEEITGEKDGITFDYMANNMYDVEEILNYLGIEVNGN